MKGAYEITLASMMAIVIGLAFAIDRATGPAPAKAAVVADPVASAPGTPPPPPAPRREEPEAPAVVERVRVPGDAPASIVRARDAKPPRLVFLPGLCSNANAYLQAFPEAARTHGGIVAIDGDQPCKGAPGFHSFTWDAARQHARIEAALAAAGVTEAPREGFTLVGYSQGASIAEQLAQRWPERYARVVLIGSPGDPQPERMAEARAVVTMSCSRDVPGRMKDAARKLSNARVPATYFEMPGCSHGHIADGDATFDVTFTWLAANARETPAGARPEPLEGTIDDVSVP
jgi:predicted esterase